MQRLNRPAHAPLGTAFFLFLSFALVSVSLKTAGVPMTLSPRLAAAIDAWNQVAQVFGASYQTGAESQSATALSPEVEPVIPSDCTRRELACARKFEESIETQPSIGNMSAQKDVPSSNKCPKAPSRRAPMTASFEVNISAGANMEAARPVLVQFGARKLETLTRRSLVKNIERQAFWKGFEPSAAIENFSAPVNFKLLVRMPSPAPASVGKAAECKVRAAISAARRLERMRARLSDSTSASPDNCEL